MLRIFAGALATALTLLLPGCGSITSPVNIKQVLVRTLDTFEKFDDYMKRYSYKVMTPELFAQFKVWLDNEMNRAPALHANRITTRINSDASIAGFVDTNTNGKVDAAEPRLFKIEIDIDNRRLIATAEGSSSYGYRPRPQSCVALLPNVLKRFKIKYESGGISNPSTLGEYLVNTRLRRGHLQRDVAELFGCSTASLNQWERNKAFPEAPWAAKIIAYIGFNPLPMDTLGQRIKARRLELGLYQRELAAKLGVNISTVKLWELDEMRPVKHQSTLIALLGCKRVDG